MVLLICVPLTSLRTKHTQCTHAIRTTQKKNASTLLKINRLQESYAAKSKALETVLHEKEYRALENERNEISSQITAAEEEALALMEEEESMQKAYAVVSADIIKTEHVVAEKNAISSSVIKALKTDIATQEAAWKTQAALVPPDLCRGYIEVRQRVPNPVVPIVSSSCSACFYGLLQQDTRALGSQTVIRCRGCYRFLFIPDSSTEQLLS